MGIFDRFHGSPKQVFVHQTINEEKSVQSENWDQYVKAQADLDEMRSQRDADTKPEFDIRHYQQPPTFLVGGFDDALGYIKAGYKVTRDNWNGPGQFLEMQVPDANSKMSLPYIFITTVTGDRVPWLASQSDLLANDWHVVR